VTNQTAKTISGVHVRAEYMSLAANNIRGFPDEWKWRTSLPPGGEQIFELQNYFQEKGLNGYFDDLAIIGWAV